LAVEVTNPRYGQNTDFGSLLTVSGQATASPIGTLLTTMNSNPDFEVNTADWTGFNGTFTRANDRAKVGSWSGKFVPDGVNTVCGYSTSIYPATALTYYGISGWINSDTAADLQYKIDFRDAGSGFIGSGFQVSTPVLADVWTFFTGIVRTPLLTTGINLALIRNQGTPVPAADAFWGDDLRLWTVDNTATASVRLQPMGENWRVDSTTVRASTNVLEASAFGYRGQIAAGSQFDSTFSGSSGDTSDTVLFLRDGEAIIWNWIGGDLDATYTLTLNGWRSTPFGGFRGAPV
jgi:hypothetical protein